MRGVVKVQIPIATADPRKPWLIYDETRQLLVYIADADVPDRIRKAMNQDAKAFFWAEWNLDSELQLGRRIGEQDW